MTPTTTAVDPAGLGLLVGPATGRPDYLADPNTNAPHTCKSWFNTAAFGYVPAGQYRPGNARPTSIRGPGYENGDLSLHRTLRLEQALNLQFRFETYSAFNHTNFTSFATQLGASNYGQITATGTPRVLQLGAKLTF